MVSRRTTLGVLVVVWLAVAGSVESAPTETRPGVAAELFTALDLGHPGLKEVAALVARGEQERALSLWRDQVVLRLRARDFGEYGWHGYVLHPRPAGAADMLAGVVGREEYLANPDATGFIDIFGMAGTPGSGRPIRWFVDANGPVEWGNAKLAALDPSQKAGKTDYPNFEFIKPFVGRYWSKGDEVYLRKALEIMVDFARHHRRGFMEEYHAKGFGDKEVQALYHCDWRLNTNGLEVGWRAKNFLKVLAGFAKCLPPGKPGKWDEILRSVDGVPARAELERIPAETLAEIALSLMRDHTGKLLWFCVRDGAVPNQRAEGLKSLAFLSAIFPDFKTTPQLVEYVTRGYEEMLSGNFLPDGGSLEQSFNYNSQDKEGLEELVRFFGDDPPPYAQLALAKVKARRLVDDGLQTPLGSLPQVGNSHHVLGKEVWESDGKARRYWEAEGIEGKHPLRPQAYTSTAFPYSGFYAMRSGWGMKDLFLFFMAGRPQRGHSMRDNNAIQVTAYGRQLVVAGGPPTYGNFRTPEAKGADFYLSEASSLKNNTVLVDGRSQSKSAPTAARAYRTPVLSRWHTSPRYDLVDGLYDLGYGDFDKGRDANVDRSVEHYRQVLFVKDARLWVVLDRMINKGDKPHRYSQVWNFLPRCEDANWEKSIAGFREEQLALDEAGRRFRTTDPAGPNIEFIHFGPQVEYRKYCGSRDPWLGWFAAGIGDARPAPDVHVNWQSEDADALLTLLIPLDKGEETPVVKSEPLAQAKAVGLDATLKGGVRLQMLCAAEPAPLDLAPVRAEARSLLVQTGADGSVSGVVLGCRSLAVGGKPVTPATEDFEFAVARDGRVEQRPIFLPEVPVIAEPKPFLAIADAEPVAISGGREGLAIRCTLDGSEPTAKSPLYTAPFRLERETTAKARFFRGDQPLPLVAEQEYRARRWRPREPDLASAEGLERGLRWSLFRFEKSIRLWDLMQRAPVDQGTCARISLEPWAKERSYGLRWEGYLRVSKEGIYRFTGRTPTGLYLFLHNPEKDLDVPPLIAPSYVNNEDGGSIALKPGLHRLRVEYIQAWNNPNELSLEIEGPGIERRPLPAEWLFQGR